MPTIVSCPSCARQLRVPEELLGKAVKCPSCQSTFTANESAPPPPPQPAPPPRAPDAGPFGGFESSGAPPAWNEYSGPPRERNVRDEAARASVYGPALALMITSGIALAFYVFFLLMNVFAGAVVAGGNANLGGRQGNEVAQVVGGIIGGLWGLTWNTLIFTAALQMSKMKSWGYALAGSILAVVPCNHCFCITIGFGIWAIVVLSNVEVKESFR